VSAAPGPDEIYWPTLWTGFWEREARTVAAAPFYLLIILLPVSLVTSAPMLDMP
jgi:hypothetical protein